MRTNFLWFLFSTKIMFQKVKFTVSCIVCGQSNHDIFPPYSLLKGPALIANKCPFLLLITIPEISSYSYHHAIFKFIGFHIIDAYSCSWEKLDPDKMNYGMSMWSIVVLICSQHMVNGLRLFG